jgi:hypothetical protein
MKTDTPRTDAAREPYYDGKTSDWVHYTICGMIERELNASKAEVERLRDALDTLTLVVGLTPILGNKEALQEAFNLARKALNPTEK